MYTHSYKFATNWLSWKDPSQTQTKKRNTVHVELAAVIFCSIFNSQKLGHQIRLDKRTTLS
jgi:hypothetical protein